MASTYLSRTQANGTSSQKFTISCWVKRGGLSATQAIWGSGSATNDGCDLAMTGTDELTFESWDGSNNPKIITTRKFRDSSAWYHIVLAVDTTQATDTNRVKIYVNGVQETAFGTSNYPSQNYNLAVSTTNDVMKFGVGGQYATSYWNGLITHAHFIDGLQYQASDFGESDSVSGIWKPKTAPSVTYGTNGVFLKFENSGAMGTDSSGNTNTFAVGGGTLTQNVDTPSNNFATLNSLINNNNGTFSNGNLTLATTTSTRDNAPATIGVSQGKWYAEAKVIAQSANRFVWGISPDPSELARADTFAGIQTDSVAYLSDGDVHKSDSVQYSGSTYTAGDIVGIALDLDNNKVYFHKNGTYQNSGVPTSGSTGTGAVSLTSASSVSTGYYFITMGDTSGVHNVTGSVNFGQGYFGTTAVASANADDGGLGIMEYDVPANYRVLCTKNIKDYG
jgi:hypothetical protein